MQCSKPLISVNTEERTWPQWVAVRSSEVGLALNNGTTAPAAFSDPVGRAGHLPAGGRDVRGKVESHSSPRWLHSNMKNCHHESKNRLKFSKLNANLFSFPFIISLLLLQFNFSYGQKEKDYFIQLLKKSSLVMDEPERKEQCFFLVAGEARRGPVGLSQTHGILWISFGQTPDMYRPPCLHISWKEWPEA